MEYVHECCRFMPRDEELILHYLRPLCNNQPMLMNKIVEVNLYDFSPEELAGRYEKLNDKEWFFFTPREKRYPEGKRPSRVTKSNGFWKITGRGKDITVNGEVIGKKSCLVYYIAKDQKTNWIMYEYTYRHPPLPQQQQQPINTSTTRLDKALCKIHLNPERKRKTTQVVVEEAVHVFMNPPLHSNQEQQQPQEIDELLLRPLGLDQEQLHQQQQKQQQWFLNSTSNLNQEQPQQQHQQVEEEEEEEEDVGDEALRLLDLEEEEPQEQEHNPTLHSNQEQHQEQNSILDSNQEQNQEARYILDNRSFHITQSNTFDAQQPQQIDQTLLRPIVAQSLLNPTPHSNQEQDQQQLPDFNDVRQQELQWQQEAEYILGSRRLHLMNLTPELYKVRVQELLWQKQQEDVLYMQHLRVLREIEQDKEQLQALLSDPLPHPFYFHF